MLILSKMLKNRTLQSWRVPQYHNFEIKITKIPQENFQYSNHKPQCPSQSVAKEIKICFEDYKICDKKYDVSF